MLRHKTYKNIVVATKFGNIHLDKNGESNELTPAQEAEFEGTSNFLVIKPTTKTKTKTKVAPSSTTTTTSTIKKPIKKPIKKKTAPKKIDK